MNIGLFVYTNDLRHCHDDGAGNRIYLFSVVAVVVTLKDMRWHLRHDTEWSADMLWYQGNTHCSLSHDEIGGCRGGEGYAADY